MDKNEPTFIFKAPENDEINELTQMFESFKTSSKCEFQSTSLDLKKMLLMFLMKPLGNTIVHLRLTKH